MKPEKTEETKPAEEAAEMEEKAEEIIEGDAGNEDEEDGNKVVTGFDTFVVSYGDQYPFSQSVVFLSKMTVWR